MDEKSGPTEQGMETQPVPSRRPSIDCLADFVVRRRAWAWGLVAAMTAVAALGWSGWRLFERPHPSWVDPQDVQDLREARATFRFRGYPLLLVVESDDFFRPERIALLRRLVSDLESFDSVDSLVWLGDVPQAGGLGFSSLLPPPHSPAEAYDEARRRASQHPLVAGQLLSPDGTTMVMPIVPNDLPGTWVQDVRRVSRETLAGSGMRARLTGRYVLWRDYRKAFHEDHYRIVAIACGLVVLLAMVIFRNLPAMLIVGAGPALGVVWTIGILKLLGEPSNELTDIILPVMVLMIGFTDGVHLVVHLRQKRAAGLDSPDAARSAVRTVGPACFLTSLTTAIGFGSLLISSSAVVRGFGRSCSIGVLLTFVAVILVIPLLANSWLGRRLHRGQERDLVGRVVNRAAGLTDFISSHAKWVAGAGVLLTAALGATALLLRPDDRLANRIPHASEAYQAMVLCDRQFGGIHWVQVVVQWPEGTTGEDVWRVLDKAETLLADEPLIRGPLSIREWLSIVPGPDSSMKLLAAPVIPEQFRSQFWQPQVRRALIVARVPDVGISRLEPALERVESGLGEIERTHAGFRMTLAGEPIVDGRVVRQLVRELTGSLALAGAVILVLLTVAYRSIRLGLVCVVPNVFPLVCAAAIRAAWDSSLDIASACSFTICLGLAVDDTIHFITRFRQQIRSGSSAREANHRTFVTVGSAMVMTTVVMISGFVAVLTSQLPSHRLFASIGCVALAAALVGDLIILPAMLTCFPGRPAKF